MNLSEERNYQKLLDTLEALGLTEKNRKLAEAYFAQGTGEQPELLKKAELQDFSGLAPEKKKKSIDYVEHLKKRKKTEELARYVHFAAAVGGSTASYLLSQYNWNLKDVLPYLSPEQEAAILAEGIAWNQYALSWANVKELCGLAKKDLKIIRRAMDLCTHKYDNARVLLAAAYLHEKRAERGSGNPVKSIRDFFGKSMFDTESSLEDRKAAEFLEANLTDSLPGVFQSGQKSPSEEELKKLQEYIKQGRPYGDFPQELSDILRGRQASQYLLTLLSGCAFLSWKHSDRCLCFLQIMADLNPEWTLDACKAMAEPSWFADQLPLLERILPLKPDVFIRWYLKNRIAAGLKRMAKQYPECIRAEARKAALEDYQFLMDQVKAGNPALYEQLKNAYSGEVQEKLAGELTGRFTMGKDQAKQYLLGQISLSELYPFVNGWRGMSGYYYGNQQKLEMMEKDGDELWRRALVLEALQMSGGYFCYSYLPRLRGNTADDAGTYEQKVESLVRIWEEAGLPIQYQADGMEGIYSGYYAESDKNQFLDAAVKALAQRLPKHREEFYTALKNSTSVGRDICYRALDEDWQQEKDTILAGAMDSSKQVKETLALICAEHREWEPDMKRFLTSRKSQERELAIRVLRKWGADQYRAELSQALEVEKSKKLKELLQNILGTSSSGQESGSAQLQTTRELAAELLKGGKKWKAAWAYETPFSPVHKKDGSLASEDYLQALLVAYADMSMPGINEEAKRLAADLNEKELGRYMGELFDKWMEGGAEAKKNGCSMRLPSTAAKR